VLYLWCIAHAPLSRGKAWPESSQMLLIEQELAYTIATDVLCVNISTYTRAPDPSARVRGVASETSSWQGGQV
jgi:hypothetical protein